MLQNNPDYSIIVIGQNTEHSPGPLWKPAVTSMTDLQQTLVRKTRKELNIKKKTVVFMGFFRITKLKLSLPRQKRTINETFKFFRIVPLAFITSIPANFLFWYGAMWFHIFNVLHILKFCLGLRIRSHRTGTGMWCTFTIPCVTKKLPIKNT